MMLIMPCTKNKEGGRNCGQSTQEKKNIIYYQIVKWLTPIVDQAQVAGLQDVIVALKNKVKATKTEKSNMFWSLN